MHKEKQQLDYWAAKWEKAQEDGVFESAPKPPTPPSQTADVSFFGPAQTHPTDTLRDVDTKYWQSVYDASRHSGFAPDPLEAAEGLIQETMKQSKDDLASKAGEIATVMSRSANPVRAGSIGNDQELEPAQLGVTFSPEEIEELAELKQKLYDFEVKLIERESKGQSGKQVETQIENLKKKIVDLSDTLSQAFPGAVTPQGD